MNWIAKLRLLRLVNKYKKRVNSDEKHYLLSSLKHGQTAFDIGAHLGSFSYYMQQSVGKNGSVHSFEPQLELYQQLLKVKQFLNWNNTTVQHLALSDSKGVVSLHIPSHKGKADTEGASILRNENKKVYKTENVQSETLDNYCGQHNLIPNFLKIDVEGNELHVLQGGYETIKKYSPKILVEVEARHCGEEQALATFKLLTELGYNGWFPFKKERIPLKRFSFKVYQAKKGQYCNNFFFEK